MGSGENVSCYEPFASYRLRAILLTPCFLPARSLFALAEEEEEEVDMGGGAGGLFGGGDDVSPALRLAVGVLLRAHAPCARCGEFAGRARARRVPC